MIRSGNATIDMYMVVDGLFLLLHVAPVVVSQGKPFSR